MPAASNKSEMKPSAEVPTLELSKVYMNTVEKKVRNLEKRKSKLDAIRKKQKEGETLEKEQMDALKHYEAVVANLECVNELHKMFLTSAADAEKLQKKQLKREKAEKAEREVRRIMDILQLQATLDTLGAEAVREDFKSGKHGAVVLTDDNLTAMDELYQLISVTREGEDNYGEKLSSAAEHFLCLLESRERPVVGTTYKELFELNSLINNCGYFERVKQAEEAANTEAVEEAEEAKEEEEASPLVQPAPAEAFMDSPHEAELQTPPTLPQTIPDMEVAALSHSQVLQPAVLPEAVSASFFTQPNTSPLPASFLPPAQPPMQAIPPVKSRPQRPEEIISPGEFSFLQESLLPEPSLDAESQQSLSDPAVVAAQPMMRPPSTAAPLPPSLMGSAPFSGGLEEGEEGLSLSQQGLDFAATQPFSLPRASDALFQDDAPLQPPTQSAQHPQHPHPMMGQGAESPAQFDLPPSIPMPPSQAQDPSQLSGQEKKFQLNASATEFQSRAMYPNMPPPNLQPPPPQSQPPVTPGPQQDPRPIPPPSATTDYTAPQNLPQAAGDFSQANSFHNSGYQRGGRGGAPTGFRGGQRGARGTNNNNSPMQNGFNPRPQNTNSRPNNRGGTSFQGFPPRNDYRPDGYQGYNNGFAGSAPYQKRGGAGGQGYPRGANNRGAGGMRGGPPRGGGPQRGAGGNRGGMSRPNNQ